MLGSLTTTKETPLEQYLYHIWVHAMTCQNPRPKSYKRAKSGKPNKFDKLENLKKVLKAN